MADRFDVEALGVVLLAELPEALLVVRPTGEVAYANSAATQLLGYAFDELQGAAVADLVPPQSGQNVDPVKWFARWAEGAGRRAAALPSPDRANPQRPIVALVGAGCEAG